jgi:hypothetical protein
MIINYWDIIQDYTGLNIDTAMAIISVILLLLLIGKVGK